MKMQWIFDNPPAEPTVYYDNISGALLDPVMVKAARRAGVDFVLEFGVYRKMPRASSVGGQFVTVKWIDVNKGDEQRPEYRCRLVAHELKSWDPTMSGTFAATPPLECLKMVLSNFMTEPADQYKSCSNQGGTIRGAPSATRR